MNTFKNEKVLTCPFCGLDIWEGVWTATGMPKEEYLFNSCSYEGADSPFAYSVHCLYCEALGPEAKSKELALEGWNKRSVNPNNR